MDEQERSAPDTDAAQQDSAPEPAETDHPTGEAQAARNAEDEPPG